MKSLSITLALIVVLTASLVAQNPCSQVNPVKIVVLGSSTAAGTGPTPRDSSWVNRYRDHLQQINPANEVINLAVGGFVTYRIMPTGFVPPAGRPNPDPDHNITKALAEQPDAIIVNLPSNDRRYPLSEQLSNFDSLFRHANNMGVPMWICTTQPISTAGSYQVEAKDSIIAKFSPFVIDFWTTLADTNNTVLSQYAADGVHLNNAGHWILLNRVIQKDIPSLIYQAASFPDIAVLDIDISTQNLCGDSAATVEVVLANLGMGTTNNIDVQLERILPGSSNMQMLSLSNGMGNCQADTLRFQVDLRQKGNYELRAFHAFAQDSLANNDSIQTSISLLGYPSLQLVADSACIGGSVELQAISDEPDFFRWYYIAAGGSPIDSGATFQIPNLTQTTTYYAEAIRGPRDLFDKLSTTTTSNVNWNGAMFDIIAHDTITIDSLALKVADLGPQQVNAFYRIGGHIGFETNAAAWTSWGNDSVMVVNVDSLVRVTFSPQQVFPGDTFAVYLHINNPSNRLSYRNTGQPLTVSNSELSIFCGSGASFNFGGNYYPRQWNGQVYYSYGSRPSGECQSDRLAVDAVAETVPQLDLGGDQIDCDSLLLDPGLSPSLSYRWSTGASDSAIWVKQSGTYWLQVSNSCGDAIDASAVELDSALVVDFDYIYDIVSPFTIGLRNLSQGGRTYVWDFGDGATSVLTNPTHTYSAPGTYQISLQAANACDTLTTVTDVFVGILSTDELGEQPFQLFPNPVADVFSIKMESSPSEDFSFFIYDLQGKKLGEIQPISQQVDEWRFDLRQTDGTLRALPAGTYLISIEGKSLRDQQLFVKH